MRWQLVLGAVAALPASAIDEFEMWWHEYPLKKDKGDARKAFVRARRSASLEELVLGLLRYRFSPDPHFQPRASTWLNKGRWADEEPDLGADAWGLGDWYARQPEASDGLFWVRGYEVEALTDVLLATGFEVTWRGDLDVLGEWLVAGYRPDSIAEEIALDRGRSAARLLRWFDRPVRRRALRWDAIRGEWLRASL